MASPSTPTPMFSMQLRGTLAAAGEEALRHGHFWVGTEHLLLALTLRPESAGATAITARGLDLLTIRRRLDSLLGRGEGPGVCPPGVTARAWGVMELALLEWTSLGYPLVTTGHLVIGMLAEPDGIAGRVLEEGGIDVESVRREVGRLLTASPEE